MSRGAETAAADEVSPRGKGVASPLAYRYRDEVDSSYLPPHVFLTAGGPVEFAPSGERHDPATPSSLK